MNEEEALPPLTDSQTEIMNVVWQHGEASLADVCEALKDRDLARNTIQTQLSRLVEKGWLHYRPVGKSFQYQATVPKAKVQNLVVKRLAARLFEGSTEGLLLTLLGNRKLTKAEADRIRALIENAEDKD